MRRVIVTIDGLTRRYELGELPDDATPTDLAHLLHMAADTIALMDTLD